MAVAVQARFEMRVLCACVSQEAAACISARGGFIATGQRAGAQRARGLQAGYPALLRIDGNRVSAPVLEMREGSGAHQHQAFGVSGRGGFPSRVWRSVAHVDNRAEQSRATAVCGIA